MSALAAVVHDATPVARPIAGWMVLAIDGLRLALPQCDVRLIELLVDLASSKPDEAAGSTRVAAAPCGAANDARGTPAASGGLEIGWRLRRKGEPWPVYCLDSGLRLQYPVPAARRMCVFIEAHGHVAGIACDRVLLLATDAALSVQPVPGCMTGMPSPITGFARHQAGITAVATATALAGYLAFLLEHGHGTHQ
jgi:hypothetical protein